MKNLHTLRGLMAIVLPSYLVGCQVQAGEHAEPGVRLVSYCAESVCTLCQQNADQRIENCNDCLDLCSRSLNPDCFSSCQNLCTGTTDCTRQCSGETNCIETAYRFDVLGEPDPEIEAACLRGVARAEECGGVFTDAASICRSLAATEDPTRVIAAYTCFAHRSCESEALECAPLPVHGLATWYCEAVAERGETCDQETVARLIRADGYLGDDAAAALRDCARDRRVTPYDACVTTFLDEVAYW